MSLCRIGRIHREIELWGEPWKADEILGIRTGNEGGAFCTQETVWAKVPQVVNPGQVSLVWISSKT